MTLQSLLVVLLVLVCHIASLCYSFTLISNNNNAASLYSKMTSSKTTTMTTRLEMFFADQSSPNKSKEEKSSSSKEPEETMTSSSSSSSSGVELVTSEDEGFLNMVGFFLVDAFWLNSDHHQLGSSSDLTISDDIRTSLVIEQASDLQDKYGPRLGARLLNSCVIAALDNETKEIVGVVTLKVTLLNKETVMEAEAAESMAKNAVAQLGPKQRRQYKNVNVDQIASELLSPDVKAITVLSNLAVSPNARRRGIAQTLCNEALAVTNEWGYNEIYLLVEEANVAARGLYETKLGYVPKFRKENETALRVDLETGSFEEIEADTLVLVKEIVV